MLQFLSALPPAAALGIAITCEVIATSSLPKTEQFTKPVPTLITLASYALAFFLLSITVKSMPVGVAYAIWCGAGIILVSMISWLWHGQQLDLPAIIGMGMIMGGTIITQAFSKSVAH
ncbi:DMT family transporter [Parendozoicomonas haliclonae]|uniref:Multidrug transporter EmrE n=1 Tax=Parendozoicomonas haliclonae TaxID=1960125 RepID=A0A1X7AJI1_9GAMM|nr:multidrug efflux SMR transporter [Parendozoicomonas haliclonae]SMA46675.1 Multidrug transporter EmrE [Parendozoicomonas haliclonae]